MIKTDLIRLIGDLLTEIDLVLGSLMPDTPQRKTLDQLRAMLDERQLELVQSRFNENTKSFKNAAKHLQDVNKSIKGTIKEVEDLESTLSAVARFVGAVDSLLGIANGDSS